RNVKKARKAGVVVVRTQSAEVASAHVALMTRSRDRRHGRGKSPGHTGQPTGHAALLRSGAAEVFQALLDGSAVSSVLVLRAPQGAYYHSAGTSPEGMAVGASHFLVQAIATELRAERVAVFNLGGADEDSGLGRFKAGFGCQRVPLPQATFFVGPAWRRRAGKLAALVQSAGKTALHPLASGTLLRSR
ncbi:MAG: GNAT family N-acetyltransferase, partial [Gemmatimonadota bacterium]|nr:GNAT family N-acetyltransferase [Gemmatimonadota bacterium]